MNMNHQKIMLLIDNNMIKLNKSITKLNENSKKLQFQSNFYIQKF